MTFASKPRRLSAIIRLLPAMLIFPATAFCLDHHFGWEMFDGLFKKTNFPDAPLTSEAGDSGLVDDTYAILGLYPELRLGLEGHFDARAQAGLEWTHSWDAENHDDWNAEAIAATLGYHARRLSVEAGLQPLRAGRGLIAYGDEPGATVNWKGWAPFTFHAEASQVLDTSPLALLSVSMSPGFLETVEVFAAGFHDRDGAMTDVFASVVRNPLARADGDLFWVGIDADIFLKNASVSGILMGEWGNVALHLPSRDRRMDAASHLFDGEISYPFFDKLSLSAFVFAAGGDSHPANGTLTAFVSPMPFNSRTLIFFNGGFSRYEASETVGFGGVTWDGAVAPGLGAAYQAFDEVSVELTAAILFPERHAFSADTAYGWEADARLSYAFYQKQRIFLEAGVLVYGDYWKDTLGYRPDPATMAAGGIDLFF